MGAGIVIGLAVLGISGFFGPRSTNAIKESAFECGVPISGDARSRFSVRFYLVAILFLLFDVEAVFFFPFAISFKKFLTFNSFIVWEMAAFVGILLVGYVYILRKKALEWE